MEHVINCNHDFPLRVKNFLFWQCPNCNAIKSRFFWSKHKRKQNNEVTKQSH